MKSKLREEITQDEFVKYRADFATETAELEESRKALLEEQNALSELIAQGELARLNLVRWWTDNPLATKQQLQHELFPDGLAYSNAKMFFEPANVFLMLQVQELIDGLASGRMEVEDGRGERI